VKGLSVTTENGSEIAIEPGRKYFINVGSVGQPRDGDWRSAYVLYDLEAGRVTLRRIEYDLPTAQRKILDAGLPPQLAERLAIGK
jgi:diadenosine tetraphosphatase ApaH/serine/threonine PP2A family protein phosphatase